MKKVLILNGPNLNLLGQREPEQYGRLTLAEITRRLDAKANELGFELEHFQSNHEGELIDQLQSAVDRIDAVVFNPGGYSHTSVAIRDAVASIKLPVIEVHLSNIHAREEFRHHSLITPVCIGSIAGFGWRSYAAALYLLSEIVQDNGK